ncbi:MAG: hypothetical protein LUE93_16935 [Bacteroides sp.]|nr:hypothetical protein [Bacteroides sp.]
MKLIQFILSLLITLCALGIFYSACITPAPVKLLNISFATLILTGSGILTVLTYKELWQE